MPETVFDIWFRENKESLRDEYEGYKFNMNQIGEKPVSFRKWARGAWQED